MNGLDWLFFIVGQASLGAVVGASTNWIAIRLLFRPYSQKRLFGIPLPYTPSVFVRHQEKLAENVQRLLRKKMLTADSFCEHLDTPEVRAILAERIENGINGALGGGNAQPAGSRPTLREMLPPEAVETIENNAEMLGYVIGTTAKKAMESVLETLGKETRAAAEFLDPLSEELLGKASEAAAGPLVDAVSDYLRQGELRDRLAEQAATAFLNNLSDGPFGKFLGLLNTSAISDSLEGFINSFLDDMLERAGESPWREKTRGVFGVKIKEALRSELKKPLKELVNGIDTETRGKIIERLSAGAARVGRSRDNNNRLRLLNISFSDEKKIRGAENMQVGDSAGEREEEESNGVAGEPGRKGLEAGSVTGSVRESGGGREETDSDRKTPFVMLIAEVLAAMFVRHAPEVFVELDLSEPIRQKIATWPPEQLENAVVSAAGKQLKALTLLGGIIGAVLTPAVTALMWIYLK